MLTEQTVDKLNALKLGAMADAFQKQLNTDEAAVLSFEERLGLLVDTEWTAREQRKLERRLRTARLRYPATLEAVDFTHPRRLNRQQILTLGACAWIAERHNVIVTGPCGIGKSFLACAFVERACRRGFAARYVRMPRLLPTDSNREPAVPAGRHGHGRSPRWGSLRLPGDGGGHCRPANAASRPLTRARPAASSKNSAEHAFRKRL